VHRSLSLALLVLAACGEVKPAVTPAAHPPAVHEEELPAASEANSAINLPPGKDGVLGPGEADRILREGAEPIVRLVDPGDEPRSDLSYGLKKGSIAKVDLALDMRLAIHVGGRDLGGGVPRIKLALDFGTKEDKGASWAVDAVVTKVSFEVDDPAQQEGLKSSAAVLDKLKGTVIDYTLTKKGFLRDVGLRVPQDAPPAAQQMIAGLSEAVEAMAVQLPNEPIGVNGKWQIVSRVMSGGADLLQSVTYVLRSRTGNKAVVDTVISQVAAGSKAAAPGMPPEVKATLKAFRSSGKGSTSIDVASPSPDRGEVTLETGMSLGVESPQGNAETRLDASTTAKYSRP
jgi:hypothetical protein